MLEENKPRKPERIPRIDIPNKPNPKPIPEKPLETHNPNKPLEIK